LLALFNRTCLGLEAQDQDSKGKTKTETMRVKTKTKTKRVTLKTKTVKIPPRDEAVPRGFPSLTSVNNFLRYPANRQTDSITVHPQLC